MTPCSVQGVYDAAGCCGWYSTSGHISPNSYWLGGAIVLIFAYHCCPLVFQGRCALTSNVNFTHAYLNHADWQMQLVPFLGRPLLRKCLRWKNAPNSKFDAAIFVFCPFVQGGWAISEKKTKVCALRVIEIRIFGVPKSRHTVGELVRPKFRPALISTMILPRGPGLGTCPPLMRNSK